MKSVRISWTVVSQHTVVVNVPDEFDTENYDKYDLENELAALDDDGFIGLTRDIAAVSDTEPCTDAEELHVH